MVFRLEPDGSLIPSPEGSGKTGNPGEDAQILAQVEIRVRRGRVDVGEVGIGARGQLEQRLGSEGVAADRDGGVEDLRCGRVAGVREVVGQRLAGEEDVVGEADAPRRVEVDPEGALVDDEIEAARVERAQAIEPRQAVGTAPADR